MVVPRVMTRSLVAGMAAVLHMTQPAPQPVLLDATRQPVRIEYRVETGTEDRPAVKDRFTDEQIRILEMVNRADETHLERLESLVVPRAWYHDPLVYSPYPMAYPEGAARSKLLIVDQPSQSFAAYESGHLVRWGPVNSGRRAHQTPAGEFHLNWRSRGRHSTVNPRWFLPWYFNFHNHRGLSFHEYALPGRPASHACVRLLRRDAMWLFEWGETWTLDERGWSVLEHGTPLWILGCYDFDEPPPWRSLAWLKRGVELPYEGEGLPELPCGA